MKENSFETVRERLFKEQSGGLDLDTTEVGRNNVDATSDMHVAHIETARQSATETVGLASRPRPP